jgi:hypothetical protein
MEAQRLMEGAERNRPTTLAGEEAEGLRQKFGAKPHSLS